MSYIPEEEDIVFEKSVLALLAVLLADVIGILLESVGSIIKNTIMTCM